MKRNVLHLIYGFLEGGTEHQLLQLVRLLQESGRYNVRIACLRRYGKLLCIADELMGYEVPEFPLTSFHNRSTVIQLRYFVSYLREHQIEVLHTHDYSSNIFGMVGGTLARIPARIASKRETAGLRSSAQSLLERFSYRLSHAVIANSEMVRQYLINAGVPPQKVVTLYNGLNLARACVPNGWRRQAALATLNLPQSPDRKFVTIVANLRHRVKDIPLFLRAARRVREKMPGATFVIAGEGELLEELQNESVQLGLRDEVFFIGRCTRIADLLAASDVCVLSSRAEGFSNSILEYMAAARPVVVTDVGGAREAVSEGESGYVVAAGDEEGMATRISELLHEPERARRMGQRGREIVERKFSCDAQLARTEELYEQLLAGRV